jgi:hypothetical protein
VPGLFNKPVGTGWMEARGQTWQCEAGKRQNMLGSPASWPSSRKTQQPFNNYEQR